MSQSVEAAVAPEFSESSEKTNPVETQEPSAADALHETALRTEDNSEEFKAAVAEAVKSQFDVKSPWQVSNHRETVKFIINCPSGQDVLVQHLDQLDLIRFDLVEDLDSFSKKLFPTKLDEQGRPVDETGETFYQSMKDPERRIKFLDTTNRLMVCAAQKPKIVNDGVVLVDSETYKKITGKTLPDDIKRAEVFGYQVAEDIDLSVQLFGKTIPVLNEGQTYAGVIGLPDRFAFYYELNKPLEQIAPFRESAESMAHLGTVQGPGNQTE